MIIWSTAHKNLLLISLKYQLSFESTKSNIPRNGNFFYLNAASRPTFSSFTVFFINFSVFFIATDSKVNEVRAAVSEICCARKRNSKWNFSFVFLCTGMS